MNYLLLTSLLWAFSFGLIKHHLMGLDAGALTTVRLGLSLLAFLPFLRLGRVAFRQAAVLMTIGLVQYGLMYVAYLQSFRYLESYQVALFTLFTPLWVTWVNDLLSRKFHPRFLGSAFLAVVGAAVVVFQGWGRGLPWMGFVLVQSSNICFAVGQVFYARWMGRRQGLRDRDVFALLYLGGFAAALGISLSTGGWNAFSPTWSQMGVMAYLGLVASGLGFYWWNIGTRKVGAGTLAVMNNLKVPLGVACSLLMFGEKVDGARLCLGGLLMVGALWFDHRGKKEVDA